MTTTDMPTPQKGSTSESLARAQALTLDQVRELLRQSDDTFVLRYRADIREQLEALKERFKLFLDLADGELTQRMQERGARAIPDAGFECQLEEQYTPYNYDTELLQQARALLPEDEGVKVVKHIPERTVVEPAHWEAGAAVSITALRKKYAGSQVADILTNAMKRDRLEDRLKIKQRTKNVTHQPIEGN